MKNRIILKGILIIFIIPFCVNAQMGAPAPVGSGGAIAPSNSGGDVVPTTEEPIVEEPIIDDYRILEATNDNDNLYDFITHISRAGEYTIVLGDTGPSTDTLAASEINIRFQQYSKTLVNLEVELASLMNRDYNLILIGHPCDNPLIKDFSCEDWPYEDGEAIIKISGVNLIVAGSTGEDTRKAAKIVANPLDYYDILKDVDSIVIKKEIDESEEQEDKEEINETVEEKKQGKKIRCYNGCLYENNCIPYGIRIGNKFCDIDKQIKLQIEERESCNNNYECTTNLCINNECMERGFLEKIIAWFKKLFGN